jgi:hypothetical protein
MKHRSGTGSFYRRKQREQRKTRITRIDTNFIDGNGETGIRRLRRFSQNWF